jgi:hypothetical protein
LSNEKIQYLYCTVSCTVSRDDRTIKIMLFPSKHCTGNKKSVTVTHLTMKIMPKHLYITYNKKILLKNILAYCEYSMTSPFFFFLSERKHCDNAATNSNSKNARSRMVASLRDA